VMSILVLFMPMQRVKSSPDEIMFRWPPLWLCCILPIAIICGQLFPILDTDFEFYPQYAVTLSNAQLGQDPTFWHQWFSINIWFSSNGIEVGVLVVAYLLYVRVPTQRQARSDWGGADPLPLPMYSTQPRVLSPTLSVGVFGALFFSSDPCGV
jgi:hypothetical protein